MSNGFYLQYQLFYCEIFIFEKTICWTKNRKLLFNSFSLSIDKIRLTWKRYELLALVNFRNFSKCEPTPPPVHTVDRLDPRADRGRSAVQGLTCGRHTNSNSADGVQRSTSHTLAHSENAQKRSILNDNCKEWTIL